MALRRISQLDPVLSTLTSAGVDVTSDELFNEVIWYVRNDPLLSTHLMEVSEWKGEFANAPSYYLSKQFDLSTLISIISADITGSLDVMSVVVNHEYHNRTGVPVISASKNSPIQKTYRTTWHQGFNVFQNNVQFNHNVVITGEGDYPREDAMSAVMTTGKTSREGETSQFEVQVPSKFFYPINACAMSAWWADLAEVYDSDGWYAPGTLVQFGGEHEITVATTEVNAVVTTNPGFILNTGIHNDYSCPVAIAVTGRTPVLISGKIRKFDRIVLDPDNPGIGIAAPDDVDERQIIAVALESSDELSIKPVVCSTRFKF